MEYSDNNMYVWLCNNIHVDVDFHCTKDFCKYQSAKRKCIVNTKTL